MQRSIQSYFQARPGNNLRVGAKVESVETGQCGEVVKLSRDDKVKKSLLPSAMCVPPDPTLIRAGRVPGYRVVRKRGESDRVANHREGLQVERGEGPGDSCWTCLHRHCHLR
eukprot:748983-Hanusia_phi.AAC.2